MTTYYFIIMWEKAGDSIYFGHIGSGNVLWKDTPTLFKTYDKARNAIRRTQTYTRKRRLPWFDDCLFKIERAVLPNGELK